MTTLTKKTLLSAVHGGCTGALAGMTHNWWAIPFCLVAMVVFFVRAFAWEAPDPDLLRRAQLQALDAVMHERDLDAEHFDLSWRDRD